ncbi:MAG: hydroxyacid dehydrogenase [Clostridia bacterium]|nr:hydroxyacid dehydrogenase [Clostridia bacterium]
MKSVFVCNEPHNVAWVFGEKTTAILQAEAGLDTTVYSHDEAVSHPERFTDTEYLFSTWGMPPFTEEEIKATFPRLKAVFFAAGSVQHFARPFLHCGVQVHSAWGANAVPVAEVTVAQIVLGNKGYFISTRLHKAQGHDASHAAFCRCAGNYEETVGIIGAGMIGGLVIEMLKTYRLHCVVYDPFLSDERAAQLGVEKVSLEEVFSRARVVSNHLANNAQTQGILNYDLFCRMRENGVFINTGRGAQVVEEDLVRILQERPDLTALLDVTNPEPPVEGHPFYTLDNCLITPHIAGSWGNEVRRMGEYMLEEYRRFTVGDPCRYAVTEKMLETMA